MAANDFRIELIGKSQLKDPIVKLASRLVDIFSTDSGITWVGRVVTLDVSDNLQIYMSCKAITGTGWTFTVKNVGTDKNIYEVDGVTGEPLESRNGERIPNFSERETSKPI